MKNITLRDGYELPFDEAALDDMELLSDMAELYEEENMLKLPRMVTRLLGKKEKQRLYDHLRGENGRVSTGAVGDALAQIFNALGEKGKNS